MMQGYGTVWPEMVSDLLAKREYGLEYTGLTDYYKFLDEYLDNQLDPSDSTSSEDYVEPIINEPIPEENEIPSSAENQATVKEPEKVETHENIVENVIDIGEESNSKFSVETSTVGVLEIKNPVAAGDQKEIPKEASYNTYWWIGIAVALAVVVILVAIIARKRHSHRKQLERQRRNNTHA